MQIRYWVRRVSESISQKIKITMQYDDSLIFLLCPKNFLPLSKHVHVHGRKERNVEQHGDPNEDGEAEGSIEAVGEVDAEDILVVGVEQSGVLAEEFTRHPGRVGDDEESVPGRERRDKYLVARHCGSGGT